MYILTIFIILFLFSLPSVFSAECGSTPTEDCWVNSNTTFAFNKYVFTDPTANGSIFINNSNVWLDCNSSLINGSGSVGYGIMVLTGLMNVTVQNCNVRDYRYGIYTKSPNTNILYNNLTNIQYQSIGVESSNNVNVSYNRIISNCTGTNCRGINYVRFSSINYNSTISNNVITGTYFAVRLTNQSGIVKNNLIYNALFYGISLINSDSMVIDSNSINNSGWNAIDIEGINNNITNNQIYNVTHHGIDFYEDADYNRSTNNLVSDNNIVGLVADNGIFMADTSYSYAIRNTISNIYGNSGAGNGIQFSCNVTKNGFNNVAINNTISNVQYGIWHACPNSNYSENSIQNATIASIRLDSDNGDLKQINFGLFTNTNFLDGYAYYKQAGNSNGNITPFNLSEQSSLYHKLNLSNNAIVTFLYSGLKNFSVTNNTIN